MKRPKIHFIHSDGRCETHEVNVGDSVMDCALDNEVVGIHGQCGGGCTCSTCHCYIQVTWLKKLSAKTVDEISLIEYVWQRRRNSRLSCQIFMTENLDGLVVHIPEKQQ